MGELPSGTVTFLFTDIEGSTRLLHELGETYADALAEHRQVLRATFARHDGVEVDTQGDAFFVAFSRASDALAAAREAGEALDGPIRVRMGVHTGEPLLTEDGYVGIDVHRAARIAAAGHGGQVLVSQSTRDLAGEDGLRDLGEHRLKDLTAPERIFQLGEGEFPPLKSLHQTNLPVQPMPLIGRERELAEVAELVRTHRLVTLTGPGGSGKTRLALQAAADVVDDFADGVWFVSLSALTDPSLVEPTIGSTIGAKEDLGAFLRGRRMLLLLDNLEQLLPEAAAVVASLDAHVLATSRERLNLYAEHEYPVETMRIDDAVALFTARARQLVPTFEPNDDVAAIVRRLDGLPLAVELAAVRAKVLTPAQIRGKLDQSLAFLTSGHRDAPERQRTLRATIEWSYGLLTDQERELLTDLAVFVGSFDYEDAEAIGKADVDTLASLVDKSLLRQTEDGRFFTLATLREYTEEVLAGSGREDRVRERHALHFLARGARPDDEETGVWRASGISEWRASVDRALPDFRAALDWFRSKGRLGEYVSLCSRIAAVWDAMDHLQEARHRLEDAAAMTAGSSLERARLLAVLANVQVHQGDLDEALPTIAAAARFAQEAGSDELVAEAHAIRGTVAYDQGHLTQAAEHYNRSVEMLRKLDKPGSVAVMTHDLALIALAGGDTTAARLLVEEAIGTARAHGFRRLEAAALGTLGYVELEADRFEEANEVLRQALAAYVSCEDFGLSVATDLYAVAAVRTLRGDPRGGRVLVRAADAYFDQIGAVPDPHARRARTRALGDGSDDCRRAESSEAEPAASLELAEAVAHARSLD